MHSFMFTSQSSLICSPPLWPPPPKKNQIYFVLSIYSLELSQITGDQPAKGGQVFLHPNQCQKPTTEESHAVGWRGVRSALLRGKVPLLPCPHQDWHPRCGGHHCKGQICDREVGKVEKQSRYVGWCTWAWSWIRRTLDPQTCSPTLGLPLALSNDWGLGWGKVHFLDLTSLKDHYGLQCHWSPCWGLGCCPWQKWSLRSTCT